MYNSLSYGFLDIFKCVFIHNMTCNVFNKKYVYNLICVWIQIFIKIVYLSA